MMFIDCPPVRRDNEDANTRLPRQYPQFDGVLKSHGPNHEMIINAHKLGIEALTARLTEVRKQLQKLNEM